VFAAPQLHKPLINESESPPADSEPKKGNVKALDRLHAGLFLNYESDVQPQFQGSPTNVSLGMVINYIDIDELNGKMTTHCWLNIVSRSFPCIAQKTR